MEGEAVEKTVREAIPEGVFVGAEVLVAANLSEEVPVVERQGREERLAGGEREAVTDF